MESQWVHIPRPGEAAEYARQFEILYNLGVPTKRIARVFQTNEPCIRQNRKRHRQKMGLKKPVFADAPRITSLLGDFSPESAHWTRMRAASGKFADLREQHRTWVAELSQIYTKGAQSETCAGMAVAEAQRYVMYSGHAKNPSALWLRGQTHLIMAALNLWAGEQEAALASAKKSMRAAWQGFDSSLGDTQYLGVYAFAAVHAAAAATLLGDLIDCHDLYYEAEAAAISWVGSAAAEILMGKGLVVLKSVFLAMKYGRDACRRYIQEAKKVGQEFEDSVNSFTLRYDVEMSTAIIDENIDLLTDLYKAAIHEHGEDTIYSWNCALDAVYAYFSMDSPVAIDLGIDILKRLHEWSCPTGASARRYFLLSITPALQFKWHRRFEWLVCDNATVANPWRDWHGI